MKKKHEALGTLDAAIELVGHVREFYGVYSMRDLDDDQPHDPRPMWEIPRDQMKQTPPNRWQAMPVRLKEQTDLPPSPLLDRMRLTLAAIAREFPHLWDLDDARRILEAVYGNLRQIRRAAEEVLSQSPLPVSPQTELFPKAGELNAFSLKAATAVAERLGTGNGDMLRDYLSCGCKGRVLRLHNCNLPHQAVGYYVYRELWVDAGFRSKFRTIIEVGGFRNGGIPEAMAADMAQILCVDSEIKRPLGQYLAPIVEYEKNEE